MRTLIVGPYAPERGAGAEAAVAAATVAIDAGHEVVVVSPRPSAAHHHRPLTGRAALWSLREEFRPRDRVWARIEPGILLRRSPSRLDAYVERAVLASVLRRAAHVTFDVGDVGLLPGGRAGALVVGAVDVFVAHSAADARALLLAGVPEDRLRTDLGTAEAPAAPEDEPTAPVGPPDGLRALPQDAGREAIEEAIRRRAAEAPVRPVRRT